MANDITNINSSRTGASDSRPQRLDNARNRSEHGNNSTSSSASTGDKVSLTRTAARLKDIEQRLASSQAPVDNSRVNQMKSAIDKGEYNVNADRVASKMIDFENSLHS